MQGLSALLLAAAAATAVCQPAAPHVSVDLPPHAKPGSADGGAQSLSVPTSGEPRAFKHGHGCGHSHPATSADLNRQRRLASRVVQLYETPLGRVPTDFIPAHEAVRLGVGGPLRVQIVWEVVDAGEVDSSSRVRQCQATTGTVQVLDESSNFVNHACELEDRVQGGSGSTPASQGRYDVMKTRTEFAVEYWAQAASVRRTDSPIVLGPSVTNTFPQISTTSYSDVDLVVIMTARPSPIIPIAGFALCMQMDQWDRCTVGHFNWVPSIFDVTNRERPDVIAGDRHTALHELAHVLGAVIVPETGGDPNPFRMPDGTPRPATDIFIVEDESAHYAKEVIKVKTPSILNLAREAYACEDMTGVPLEDVPLGKGAHWESRVLGPELMSYGSSVGEAYVSDFTLAFLNDTNQYAVNFTMGGRLVEPETQSFTIGSFGFLQSVQEGDADRYDPPEPLSPGYPRWGRGEGCDFVLGSAKDWSERYRCSEHQSYGCSFDNRESAVCVLNDAITADAPFTCRGKSGPCANPPADRTLPSMYQYFTDDEAAEAFPSFTGTFNGATTGGYSSSMDYVPVRLGYWNCADTQGQASNASRNSEEGVDSSLTGSLFGSDTQEEMDLFGGQAHCPECRCFRSSLIEVSSGTFDPRFPAYGLCYRSNCYREDYLQIAIKNQIGGVSWYKCPTNGGKLYIAGFTGAFTCPDAEDFCRHEQPTGIKYPETDIFWEFLFWGVSLFLVVFFTCICFVPCCRDKMVACGKYRCGVLIFDPVEKTFLERGRMPSDELYQHVPEMTAGFVLLGTNTITLAAGFMVLGISIYALAQGFISTAATPLIALGVFVTIVSLLGMVGGRKIAAGVNCAVLLFFYTAISIIMGILWLVVYVNAFADNWEVYVDRNFDTISDAFPGTYDQDASREVQVQQATDVLVANASIIVGLLAAVALLYGVGAYYAAVVAERFRIVSTTYTVLAISTFCFGLMFVGGAIYLFLAGDSELQFQSTGGASMAGGIFFFLAGALAYIGAFKRSATMVMTVIVVLLGTIGSCIAVAYFSFTQANEVPDRINAMSDEEVNELNAEYGYSLSRDELIVELQDNLRVAGLAASLMAVFMVVFIAVSYLMYVQIGSFKEDSVRLEKLRQKSLRAKKKGFDQEASAQRKARHAERRQRAHMRA